MKSFEFLITSLDIHYAYLKESFKTAKDIESQTWYRAKIGLLDGLRNQIIKVRENFENNYFPDEGFTEEQTTLFGQFLHELGQDLNQDVFRKDFNKTFGFSDSEQHNR